MLLPTMRRETFALIAVLVASCWNGPADAQPAAPAPLKFDTTGVLVGEQLPNLTVYALDGKPDPLESVWSNHGVLLLTSSLSCPKSRSSYPHAEELANKLGDQLPVEIIYVLEAHPKTDPSPYRGYEDLTAENRRDGILCRQPKTLEERLKLANQFKERLHVKPAIHIDGMDNAVWAALGGGPNMGVLVDERGIVIARQSWFDAPSMQKAIDEFLEQAKAHQKRNRRMRSEQDQAVEEQLNAAKIEPWHAAWDFERPDPAAALELLKKFPGLAKYTTENNSRFTHGETVLALAAKGGNASLVEAILAQGADVNAQNDSAPSALHFAAKEGRTEVAALLIKHGADVNLKVPAGPTPLQEAAIYGHRDVVDLLLKAGAKPNFFFEVASGNVDSVRKAIDADPTRAPRPDGWSRTPLDYAAATGQLAMLKLLYSVGVRDIAGAAYSPDPAIHWAARQKQVAAVDFLLNQGDDPNTIGTMGDTLLHLAAVQNDSELAKVVLRHKPNLQAIGIRGNAALHAVVQSKSYDVAALLLSAGADPNIGMELDRGTSCAPFSTQPSHETPLQLAAQSADVRMLGLLLSKGAAINLEDANGWTALHDAVSGGDEETMAQRIDTVRFLLAHGADVNAKNSEGKTPLDVTNHEALRPILKEHGAKLGTPVTIQ